MSSLPVFPNYTQMRRRLPVRAWHPLRAVSVAAAFGLCLLLVLRPAAGLALWWGFIIPVLPLVFVVAPGLWRNLCPIAALNQTPRLFGFTRGLTLPNWLKEYGYVIGFGLFFAIIPTRKVVFNDNGPALAALLAAVLVVAYLGGLMFKGKSGWCSSGVCPLFPAQRLYGQTPFVVISNSHCQPCVGCAKNCYDFNPNVAYLADLHDEDSRYTGYRRVFAGAFPGLIVAFYVVPGPPDVSAVEMYGRTGLYMLAGLAIFVVLETFAKVSLSTITALFGAAALNLYYWYNLPLFATRLVDTFDVAPPNWLVWSGRGTVLALTAVWWWRTRRKEGVFVRQAAARAPRVAAEGSRALGGLSPSGSPEVIFMPDERRVVAQPGRSILEIAEQSGLPIESGCRMGVCGADPVAILAGMEQLTAVSDDERNTLERLGLASNTRMACVACVQGSVRVSLKPERPRQFSSSVMLGFRRDPSIKQVVIIGNGIAGVTAADHLRRRHPDCQIQIVAREQHQLYNRMAIERLVYGRSAMSGLYLQDEQWYRDLELTTWLNTRATGIDPARQVVTLGVGEELPYDRLILAMGSSSTVPAIPGFGIAGSFVMREADDALAIRAFAQAHGCRQALVAGGGLLGLEAAYALHKLGLSVTVLERSAWPLRRQVDERAGGLLRRYLEGLGIEVALNADTGVIDGDARVQTVTLKDGRRLPADLFVACAGITPNVELARAAGLQVNRGVLVDDQMRTSAPAVFAAGDVAEHRGQVHGLWPVAAEQAQIAAVNALGGTKPYTGSAPVTMLKVAGVDLTSIGRVESRPDVETVIALEEDGGCYRRLVIDGDRIVGAVLLGYPALSPLVSAAIKRNADISALFGALRAGQWDGLKDLPERPAVVADVPPPRPPVAPAPAEQRGSGPGAPPLPVTLPLPGSASRFVLRVVAGPNEGAVYQVDDDGASLGRSDDNRIMLADDELSRRHALIEAREGGYWLSDRGSTNGTYLNGAPVTAARPLQLGDVITLGRTRLKVE